MNRKPDPPSRLMTEMIALAGDMRANGTMDQATFDKIATQRFDEADATAFAPLSAEDVRGIREQARMSQAVFARHLNVTVGYISALERGAKRPTGTALALLTVIRRKGIATLL